MQQTSGNNLLVHLRLQERTEHGATNVFGSLSFDTSTIQRELRQNVELLDLKVLRGCFNRLFLKAFAAAFEFTTQTVCVFGAFPAGSQRLLHRVFKAKHATRVAGCMTVCDATWHTGGLPDTMAFFHPTALAGQSSQRAESQEAETQEDLRMCFQDMKSSIFLLCHLSFLHLLHHI